MDVMLVKPMETMGPLNVDQTTRAGPQELNETVRKASNQSSKSVPAFSEWWACGIIAVGLAKPQEA
jgi:hypothetical protein